MYMYKWIFIWWKTAKNFELEKKNIVLWTSTLQEMKFRCKFKEDFFPVGLLNALCFFYNVFLAFLIVFSGIISFSQLLYICTCFWYVKSFILQHEPLAHSINCALLLPVSFKFIFSFPVGLWINARELAMMFAHYKSCLNVIFLNEKKK